MIDHHSAYNAPVYPADPDPYHDRREPLGWRIALVLIAARRFLARFGATPRDARWIVPLAVLWFVACAAVGVLM